MKSKGNSLSYDVPLKEKARTLRNNPTPAEKIFWNALRRMSFYKSLTFNRQKPIDPYIVDFYCHRLSLVIEIDGDSHGESDAKVYDPACVKTWITDVILRDKFSLFYNSRLSYFEFTVFVGTNSI